MKYKQLGYILTFKKTCRFIIFGQNKRKSSTKAQKIGI